MTCDLTRRRFLSWLGMATSRPSVPRPTSPARTWIILARNWEYNDEFSYPEGTCPGAQAYSDRAAAEAACQRLCAEFFAAQTPAEFEPDWDAYFPDRGRDFDESAVTWEELVAAGFPTPYLVHELTAAEESPP